MNIQDKKLHSALKLLLLTILTLVLLSACSKGNPVEPVVKHEAQSQPKLTYQDCSDLKAELEDLSSRHLFDVLDSMQSEETLINTMPMSEEELETAAMMPRNVSIQKGESIENFNQRMKDENETAVKISAEKKSAREANTAKVKSDFHKMKSQLKNEIKDCFDSLEK